MILFSELNLVGLLIIFGPVIGLIVYEIMKHRKEQNEIESRTKTLRNINSSSVDSFVPEAIKTASFKCPKCGGLTQFYQNGKPVLHCKFCNTLIDDAVSILNQAGNAKQQMYDNEVKINRIEDEERTHREKQAENRTKSTKTIAIYVLCAMIFIALIYVTAITHR